MIMIRLRKTNQIDNKNRMINMEQDQIKNRMIKSRLKYNK